MTIQAIHRGVILLLWAFFFGPIVAAQEKQSSQLGIRGWQVEDGLPQNQVRAICQTRTGYLWLATFDGLARFDGVRFVVFNRANTPELRSNIFTSLYEDISGTLWIGSDGGLVRYRDQRFTTFTTVQGLAADMITHVTGTPDGRLLVATRNHVQTVQSDTVNRTPIFSVPANRSIRQLCVSRSGDLWVASNEGAVQIRDGQVHRYGAAEGLSSTNLLTVMEDQSGSLWFGTVGQGVIRWQQGKVENFSLRPGQSDNIVYALTQDPAGQLWAGTHPLGLSNCQHMTMRDNFIDRAYIKKDSMHGGYYGVWGSSHCLFYNERVRRIRHFALMLPGCQYNVVYQCDFEVDVNFHDADDGHNLVEKTRIATPVWHSWDAIGIGAKNKHRPPGPNNWLYDNDVISKGVAGYSRRGPVSERGKLYRVTTAFDQPAVAVTDEAAPRGGTLYAVTHKHSQSGK